MLAGGTVLATGAVRGLRRLKGHAGAKMKTPHGLEQDIIEDDQSLIIKLKEWNYCDLGMRSRGNNQFGPIRLRAYGRKCVYAVMGGFHLSGPDMASCH